MSARFPRVLTPLGWLVVAMLALGLLLLIGKGAGLNWDPFGLEARRHAEAERRAERAEQGAAARAIEAEGRGRQAGRLRDFHQQGRAVDRATIAAEQQARYADDADKSLDDALVRRLDDHDRELCRLSPHLGGCAASVDPAVGSRGAVRAGATAAPGDGG